MGKATTMNGKEYHGTHLLRNMFIFLGTGAACVGIYKGIDALKGDKNYKAAETREPKKNEMRMENPNEYKERAIEKSMRIENIKKYSTSKDNSGNSPEPPKGERYGKFTKSDFADVIEPRYRRTISPNVDILPEEIERVTKLTTKQLETLYRKQWGVLNERIDVPKAIKEFFESNGYKGPGWLVWVVVDEDPNINYRSEIIFENEKGQLTLHNYTLR